jgi:hypothetical protein
MSRFFAIILFFAFSSQSFAADSLVGAWKYLREECKSGAPVKTFGTNASFDIKASFTENEMSADMKISMKYTDEEAALLMKHAQQAVDFWNQQPDSEQKRQELARAQEFLDMVKKYSAGVSCSARSSASYSLNGRVLTMQQKFYSSDCPGAHGDESLHESEVSFEGDILKLVTAVNDDNHVCEKGDSTVSIFSRIK